MPPLEAETSAQQFKCPLPPGGLGQLCRAARPRRRETVSVMAQAFAANAARVQQWGGLLQMLGNRNTI